MEIAEMKEWIRHSEIRAFLEDATSVSNEWLTIYHRSDELFQLVRIVPILFKPQQFTHALQDSGWGREYNQHSRQKLVLNTNRSDFLPKKFETVFPEIRRCAACYQFHNGETFVRKEVQNSREGDQVVIKMRRDVLGTFLEHQRKKLVLGIQNTRYSERTLKELGLDNDLREFSGEGFRYHVRAEPVIGANSFRSTMTVILGKKLIRFPEQGA